MLKQILIPVAAFAVTVTSAAAFGTANWSELDIDLTDSQLSALEEAAEIRTEAQDAANEILVAAGIDEEKMKEIKGAAREAKQAEREAMQAALESGDYTAFVAAIGDSPLAASITSEADFEKYASAQELLKAGDREAAQEIFAELEIEHSGDKKGGRGAGGPGRGGDRQSTDNE